MSVGYLSTRIPDANYVIRTQCSLGLFRWQIQYSIIVDTVVLPCTYTSDGPLLKHQCLHTCTCKRTDLHTLHNTVYEHLNTKRGEHAQCNIMHTWRNRSTMIATAVILNLQLKQEMFKTKDKNLNLENWKESNLITFGCHRDVKISLKTQRQ